VGLHQNDLMAIVYRKGFLFHEPKQSAPCDSTQTVTGEEEERAVGGQHEAMLQALIWRPHHRGLCFTRSSDRPEGAGCLGVSVLDDAGVVRAWKVMRVQVGSTLIPSEAAQVWIDSLPSAS
jgi:hypothetical protein